MRSTPRVTASAVVGGLAVLCLPIVGFAQGISQMRPVAHLASLAAGSIAGLVQDERGAPIPGAMVSALGSSTAFAVTDRGGRFELRTLSPGPYLLRAHLAGFVASRGQVVDVHPSARASSSIALRHSTAASSSVLAAGLGGSDNAPLVDVGAAGASDAGSGTGAGDGDDHSEIAWRLRHARRAVLKDATVPGDVLAGETAGHSNPFDTPTFFDRAFGPSARLASNFFSGTPFSGQVNLLTTGSFDSPQQLFSTDNFSRGIAYLALGAPIGDSADWTARAALTQGDSPSWIIAGDYSTRAPAKHRYDIGMSYAAQRDAASTLLLRDATDGTRNAGAIYGFDTYSISPILTLSYGGRYAYYDYLDKGSLISPRMSLTVEPADHFRVSTMVSSRAVAPGAEEFQPRLESGVWLPPQRTFSALDRNPLEAERANHVEVEVEHDIAAATVSLRGFHQRVSNQLVTIFGADMLMAPGSTGHYWVTNGGDIDTSGLSAGIRAAVAGRFHGSVEYTLARSRTNSLDADAYLFLLAPSTVRPPAEHIHDVSTSLEADVPETATRVVVLYRVSNGFARPVADGSTTAMLDSRFDIQVRQSLPFMDFSSARWEMLVAVRNFFYETAPDQSIYDELLVVRPPTRVVGGLTLKF
jgi:hypothetical protein